MDALLAVSAEGTTVLVATHDKNAVDRLRRRVIAIERGTLARDEAEGAYGYAE
jgi:cell division transport system ATP-binding protein